MKPHLIKMAGMGEHMEPAFAEHSKTDVVFGAHITGGRAVIVSGPRLTKAEALRFVAKRLERFEENPESRESDEDALRRKLIAAQGSGFVANLIAGANKTHKSELLMMFSAHSHTNGGSLREIQQETPQRVTIGRDGSVRNLSAEMTDNEGRSFQEE